MNTDKFLQKLKAVNAPDGSEVELTDEEGIIHAVCPDSETARQFIVAITNHDQLLEACKYALSVLESLSIKATETLEDHLDEPIDLHKIAQAIQQAEG